MSIGLDFLRTGSSGVASAIADGVPNLPIVPSTGVSFPLSTVISDLYDAVQPATKWNARGDGTDQTAQLNKAFVDLAGTGQKLGIDGHYALSQTGISNGQKYCLLSSGTGIVGKGPGRTWLYPAGALASDVDYVRVEPLVGVELFLEISDFLILPGPAGRIYGDRGIVIDTPNAANMSALNISRVYAQKGNGPSVSITNTGNGQGIPALATFQDNILYSGLRASGLGDSNKIIGGSYRTYDPTASAIDITCIHDAYGGVSGGNLIDSANLGGLGCLIRLRNGHQWVIRNPNAELGNEAGALGGPNRCLIDLDGSVGTILGVHMTGGIVSAFATASVLRLIRLGNVVNCIIDDGVDLANGTGAAIAAGIEVTSGSTNSKIGTPYVSGGVFTTVVLDNGVGTAGIRKAPTYTNGFTDIGYGFEGVTFRKEGKSVRFSGAFTSPTSATGKVMFTLPMGFRPGGSAHLSPLVGSITIDIASNGAATYHGPDAAQVGVGRLEFTVP